MHLSRMINYFTECPVLQQLFLTGYVYNIFLRILTRGSMSEFNFGQKQQQMLLQRILKINWMVPDLICGIKFCLQTRWGINPYPSAKCEKVKPGNQVKTNLLRL